MRNSIRKLLILLTLGTSAASAVVVTLGPSSQSVTFTGTGPNPAGAGTARVSWGACVFDGTKTTCTVSGPYTGIGSGGTYNFVLVYPGNGPTPLGTVANPAGSDLINFALTAGSFTFFLAPSSGDPVNFYDLNFNTFFSSSSDSCTVVSTCGVGAVGLSIGGTIKGPVTGQFDTTPMIAAVQTAGSYGGSSALAPGTWIEIYGSNLATTQSRVWAGADFNGAQAPTALGGTTVTVGGKNAYVDFVSPGQVNVQVPSGISLGSQPVVVTTFGGASAARSVMARAAEPGILAPAVFKFAGRQYAVALFPDNQTYALPPGTTNNVPTARAKPGDTLIL